ncbi:MAG: 2,3-bisphosphoglycerate-independent phosphoglycerate mutase, partial [bacterium]|nr:2,3-bisphosphoglycerate-independent phosphoglycerate mutase [bacterium]
MKTISHRPTVLCILDGLGLNPNSNANAVALANKPTIDKLMQTSPFTTLITHGTRVGLPEGHMGNSEVGHLNIGAGRVVEQWLYRITREFDSGFLDRSKVLNKFLSALKKDSKIHLIGLFSTGGVHSHADLLFQIINRLEALNFKNLAIHVILDGRDTSPTVGASDLKNLL